MIDIFNMIDYSVVDSCKLHRMESEDNYFVRLTLYLKCPGRSIKDGFVCFRNVIISAVVLASLKDEWDPMLYFMNNNAGEPVESDDINERRRIFFELMGHKEQEAKELILSSALPFIEDGYTDISGNISGPWTSLIS